MITTNGARLHYLDPVVNGYVCFCTLHGNIEAIVFTREVADYYVEAGFTNLIKKYKRESVPDLPPYERQVYQQSVNKARSKYGLKPYIY